MNTRKTFTLRIEENTLQKLHYISKLNRRSVNNQIETLIDDFISGFEKANGEIPVAVEE